MNLFKETQLDQMQMKMADRALNSVGDEKILKLFGPNATELQKAITYAIMNSSPSGMPSMSEIKGSNHYETLWNYIYYYIRLGYVKRNKIKNDDLSIEQNNEIKKTINTILVVRS